MEKKYCISCRKKTNRIKRSVSTTWYDKEGNPHMKVIEVPVCEECGRPAP